MTAAVLCRAFGMVPGEIPVTRLLVVPVMKHRRRGTLSSAVFL